LLSRRERAAVDWASYVDWMGAPSLGFHPGVVSILFAATTNGVPVRLRMSSASTVDVRERPAARAECRERVVAGRVDEQQPREVEVVRVDEVARHLGDGRKRHGGRPDVLGDGAGLALAHRRATNRVEQRRLPVVDVPEHGDDGGSECLRC
jgi:hypothetical protein